MKLHTKVVFTLLAVMALIIGIGQLVQLNIMKKHISGFSNENIKILKEREERFVTNIHSSVERAVAGSLERGEMLKFTKTLEAQKDINGLLEFSLYNREGVVTHSTENSFIGKKMPGSYNKQLDENQGVCILWEDDAIHVFKNQPVTGDCIRCHTAWKAGESGGVTSLRFSKAALNNAETQAASTVSSMQKSTIINSLILLLIILSILAIAVSLLITRLVIKPLEYSLDMLKDMAEGEGDLTKRLKVKSNKDIVGAMSEVFNLFIEKLQGMFKTVRGDVITLTDSSVELAGISNDMSNGVEDMASSLSQAASSTKEVNEHISLVARSIKESSTSVNTIARSTEEMSSTIKEIAQNTVRANDISNEAVRQAQNSSERVRNLGEAAKDINKITETIAEISEQTNLLALNATIEAARAGEAGKGFAVVANEVKDLARQTAEATREIKSSIEGIQTSTGLTIDEINNVLKVINDVNSVVSNVAAAADEQAETTRDISSSITQVAQGMGEVSNNIEESSSVLNDVSKGLDSVSTSADEILNRSSNVNNNANKLKNLANTMNEMFGKYKV
ncbi:MAG: methyl-accepting chemotaxis protein [Desulfobacteraceae bacterium]|jgi:methyl-accepting chemotaxis protein